MCSRPVYQLMSTDEFSETPIRDRPVISVFNGFKQSTTAHGIPHVDNARGPVKKIIWLIFTLVACGLLIYYAYTLFDKFFGYPVNVLVDVVHQQEVLFPAVTVCNMNAAKLSKINEIPELQTILGISTNDSSPARRKKRQTDLGITARHETSRLFQQYLSELNLESQIDLGHRRYDFILSCEYAGSECSQSDFYEWYNPTYGNCFTFNSGWNTSDDASLETSHLTGPHYGLDLVLNIDQDEYLGTLSHTAGARVVVHSQLTMPFPEDEGFTLGPGYATYIGLTEVDISRLGGLYGDCEESATEQNFTLNVYEEYYPVYYSIQGCYKTCFQRNVISTCDCYDANYPGYGEAFDNVVVSVCDLTDVDVVACHDGVLDLYKNDELNCDCHTECNETEYVTSTSFGEWPSQNYKTELLLSLLQDHPDLGDLLFNVEDEDKYQANLAKLSLYFQEFNLETITEDEAYLAFQLVSDLGGILGLFIGFSVLTIAEFLELGLDTLIVGVCKTPCCKDKSPGGSRINIVSTEERGRGLSLPSVTSKSSYQGVRYDNHDLGSDYTKVALPDIN